jgi:glutamyl-tRNA synthetase
MDVQGPVRVRFAPNCEAPFLGLFTRTILYSVLFVRHYGGQFILRIDDTDVDHQVPGALETYLGGMRWLGLDWDEGPDVGGAYGPYFQSQRLPIYKPYIEELLAKDAAYYCYCTPERLKTLADAQRQSKRARKYDRHCAHLTDAERKQLAALNPTPTVRFRTPDTGEIRCSDMLRGETVTNAADVGDFIIMRADGWPTYHLAVVVDDTLMKITHVIRGIEGLANMALQALVYDAFGFRVPQYLHFPLVRTDGVSPAEQIYPRGKFLYLDEMISGGYLPDAIVNYYALLGHSYPGDQEIMSREQLIQAFDYRRISKVLYVNQSLDKLAWMNRRYIQHEASIETLIEYSLPFLHRAGLVAPDDQQARARLTHILPLVRTRMQVLSDVVDLVRFVFDHDVTVSRDQLAQIDTSEGLSQMLSAMVERLQRDRSDHVQQHITEVAEQLGVESKMIKQALALVLTGTASRLPIGDMVKMLGTDEVTRRLNQASDLLATACQSSSMWVSAIRSRL